MTSSTPPLSWRNGITLLDDALEHAHVSQDELATALGASDLAEALDSIGTTRRDAMLWRQVISDVESATGGRLHHAEYITLLRYLARLRRPLAGKGEDQQTIRFAKTLLKRERARRADGDPEAVNGIGLAVVMLREAGALDNVGAPPPNQGLNRDERERLWSAMHINALAEIAARHGLRFAVVDDDLQYAIVDHVAYDQAPPGLVEFIMSRRRREMTQYARVHNEWVFD